MAGADTFYLSQAEEDFPLVNEDYSLNGQNMIIAYNSPVKDITVIGTIQLGILFFSEEIEAFPFIGR